MIERDRTEEARAVPALSGGVLAPAVGASRWVTRFCRTKPLGAIGGAITLLLILIAVGRPRSSPPTGPRKPWALRRFTIPLPWPIQWVQTTSAGTC